MSPRRKQGLLIGDEIKVKEFYIQRFHDIGEAACENIRQSVKMYTPVPDSTTSFHDKLDQLASFLVEISRCGSMTPVKQLEGDVIKRTGEYKLVREIFKVAWLAAWHASGGLGRIL